MFTKATCSSYLVNRTRGEGVCRSWASPPSGSSRTAWWCPEAGREKEQSWFQKQIHNQTFLWPLCFCFPHQAFDDLQQLLHDHSNALIAQQPTHDLNVRGTHKVPVGAEYAAVRQIQGLQTKERQVMMKKKGKTQNSPGSHFNTSHRTCA